MRVEAQPPAHLVLGGHTVGAQGTQHGSGRGPKWTKRRVGSTATIASVLPRPHSYDCLQSDRQIVGDVHNAQPSGALGARTELPHRNHPVAAGRGRAHRADTISKTVGR